MTDVTDLGEIVVVGQRRRPGGTFPSGGGSGGGGGTGAPEQNQLGEPEPEEPVPHPCDDALQRKIWNADAAAAAAVAALMAKAASLNDGSSLGNREFGTHLISGANGSVGRQIEISVGEVPIGNQIPRVDIDLTGVTSGNWMGDVHNHPSGDGRLSGGEWADFINFVSTLSAAHPERIPELPHLSVYVVVLDPSAPNGYKIYAYNRDSPPDSLGEEVNPDAQPCPNA